jgi:hypothetical protein
VAFFVSKNGRGAPMDPESFKQLNDFVAMIFDKNANGEAK